MPHNNEKVNFLQFVSLLKQSNSHVQPQVYFLFCATTNCNDTLKKCPKK